MSYFLVLMIAAGNSMTGGVGITVIPQPYPTIEECKSAGMAWSGVSGGWPDKFKCVPAPKEAK